MTTATIPTSEREDVKSSSRCCQICGFSIEPSGKRGRPRVVHEQCAPEYQRAYYESNKDSIAEKQRAYYESNKARKLAGLGTHGTEREYQKGCRCDHCNEAQAEREL